MIGWGRIATLLGWSLYGVGMVIWIIGYYVPGHLSAITQFDGPVFRAFEGHAFGTDGADRLTSHSRSRGV